MGWKLIVSSVLVYCLSFPPSVPPRILPGPRVMKVQVKHSIDLPCVAQGVPQPSVNWKKDSITLVVDRANYSLSTDGTLTVRQVMLSHEGVYTCVASNVAGLDEASIQLQVQGEAASAFPFLDGNVRVRIWNALSVTDDVPA